jgi:hypothetical protein
MACKIQTNIMANNIVLGTVTAADARNVLKMMWRGTSIARFKRNNISNTDRIIITNRSIVTYRNLILIHSYHTFDYQSFNTLYHLFKKNYFTCSV